MVITSRKTFIALLLALAVLGSGTFYFIGLWAADTVGQTGHSDKAPKVYALVELAREEFLLGDPRPASLLSDKAHELMKRNELTLIKSQLILKDALGSEQVRGLPIMMCKWTF
jgi:hypothetical protein